MKNAIGFKVELTLPDKTVRGLAEYLAHRLINCNYDEETVKAAGYANN